MKGYRFARRSFLRGVGGALGLRVMLRNLEAAAQGMTSPPRFLVTHHPVGTVRPDWEPKGTGTTYVTSRILKPFEDAGLRQDMIVLYGLSTDVIGGPGGGHEKGTVVMMTGVAPPGTRGGEPESDDSYSGGPSFDQIFLARAASLKRPGKGYVNAICDSRVDFLEYSTQCLSYGYTTKPVAAAIGGGPEATPLLPELSPVQLYMSLFAGMMPGGATPANQEALLRALRGRKSVLDFALRELDQMKRLAPASEASRIDIHAAAVRAVETQISGQLSGTSTPAGGCAVPAAPPATMGRADDRKTHNDYGNPTISVADDTTHEAVGKLHTSIIRAAFVCDLVRVATFQWSPGTNHVAFKGLFPGEANTIYMHHPLSHRVGTGDTLASTGRKPEVEFLSQVELWYATRMAAILADFKKTTDAFGNSLLDTTVIPYVTEVAATGHEHYPMPVVIFGGRKLGMKGGQYQYLDRRPHNDMWLTCAQAFGLGMTDLSKEAFAADPKTFSGPIPGLWAPPA